MRIEEEIKLDYSDVLFRPKRSTLKSRKEVNLERTYRFKYSNNEWTGIPIIASNMDGVGDEYDYTESHCPVCLTMVVEKLNQRPDIEIDNPESIVLTDVIVKAQSGNTRSIGLKFLFNDTDINVGYLSENEIQIFENGDNDAIENIIKDVAMDEWRSLKRAELMETHTKELGEQFKDYTSDWLGKEININ